MSPLVRRTTLVVVALALAATGCGGAKKKAATPAPASTTPSTAPTSASPSPAATESPAPSDAGPEAIAAAKKLLVVGKDYGKGWKEEIDDTTGPQEDSEFCGNDAPKGKAAQLFSVVSHGANPAAPDATFSHEVIRLEPGAAQSVVEAYNAMFAACKPLKGDSGALFSAKSTGPGRADLTIKSGDFTFRGALRFETRGDYFNSVVALDHTIGSARKIADKVMRLADKKFDAAGIA